MADLPKYAVFEVERRWTVEQWGVPSMEALPYRRITDLYIRDTQLRLRKEEGERTVYKLCKKYGKTSGYAEPITNLYLSEAEYTTLAALPGDRVAKRRYAIQGGALDVYETVPEQVFFEVEFESEEEAMMYQPPRFVSCEVTHDRTRTGAATAAAAAHEQT